ncbi:MAG: sugar phosphate isomerase/epimerase [Hyphomicrobiales bacterium]|nr:sugar phosphate isomerase/epimerase [Hyphomicrobiales bacterium]
MSERVLGVGYTVRSDDDFDFKKLTSSLHEADRLGVDFLELPLYALDVTAGGRIVASKLRAVKNIAADRSYRYTVHGPLGVNLMDIAERLPLHKSVMQVSLEAAAELGAVHYVLHSGFIDAPRQNDAASLHAQQRDILSEFAPIAESLGIIITIENLFTYDKTRTTALPSQLARDIEAINHPNIHACLDFSHGFINSTLHGADFVAEAKALAPYAKHLHIHDSFGRLQNIPIYTRSERVAFGLGDLHLPIGWGAIPWDDLMTSLDFPQGLVMNLELAPPYWSELETSVASLRRLETLVRERTAS